jgi:UPF0042 nucleotide-binding protein
VGPGLTQQKEKIRDASPDPAKGPSVLVVTGMSGAGRTTAITALEDLGYEALHNFPLSLFETLIEPVAGTPRPIAIGVESRTRGFSARALAETVDRLRERWGAGSGLVFLDCANDVLISRFNQTRRRHPLAPAEDAATGIIRERDVLEPVMDRADAVIDTTEMTPHDLKAEIQARFSPEGSTGLSVMIRSFSYGRGVPHGADMVLDCRFLKNPYWEEDLRALDGRDPQIQGFVKEDPLYHPFFGKLCDMVAMLLPAYRDEGKAHFTIALGCTGGRHRSVTVTEALASELRGKDWPVSVRHHELERRSGGGR